MMWLVVVVLLAVAALAFIVRLPNSYAYNLTDECLEKRDPGNGGYHSCADLLNQQFLERVQGDPRYLSAVPYLKKNPDGNTAYRINVTSDVARWLDEQTKQNKADVKMELTEKFRDRVSGSI